MKIRIFTWEEACKAAAENEDDYYDENVDCIFGLEKSWPYWGKTVEPELPIDNFDGYDVDDWAVPSWLCEVVEEDKKESREIPQGWFCPRCGRIVSPFVNYCDCGGIMY